MDLTPRTGECYVCHQTRLLYPSIIRVIAAFRGQSAEHSAVETWSCEACGKVALDEWREAPFDQVIDTQERRERRSS
jgi:hypothetical protein